MYRLAVSEPTEKKLSKLDEDVRRRVAEKIVALKENPRPPGCLKMKDSKEHGWRIRVGKFRVLYQIDDTAQVVRVYDVDNREGVYKDKK